MARTALTAQVITRAGIAPSYAAANVDGHSWPNNGTQLLQVKNASGSPITVTFPIPVTVDGQAVASKTVSVPATTGDRLIGPFPVQYNQLNGDLNVDFSAVTSVTVALLQFTPVS
jgi:hypothetical protein